MHEGVTKIIGWEGSLQVTADCKLVDQFEIFLRIALPFP